MGIENLLPFLSRATTAKRIEDYAGKTVGVDAMGWLHRGAVACAYELLTGKDSDKFLTFFIRAATGLLAAGVTPLIVFDGDRLPAKKLEEDDRRRRRQSAREEALALIAEKDAAPDKIRSKCVSAITVTSEMVLRVINALRTLNIQYLVAPYEADAQLAFLQRTGVVHAVLAEDSDILTYGCRLLLTKFDMRSGQLRQVDLSFAFQAETESAQSSGGLGEIGRLATWSLEQFQELCVFGGCDYGGSVAGVGLKTAFKALIKSRTAANVLRNLRVGNFQETSRAFFAAKRVFQFAWVFDASGRTVRMQPLPDGLDEALVNESTGLPLSPEIAADVMTGEVDVKTGLRRALVVFSQAETRTMEILASEKENIERTRLRAVAAAADKLFDRQCQTHNEQDLFDPLQDLHDIHAAMGMADSPSSVEHAQSQPDDLMDLANMFASDDEQADCPAVHVSVSAPRPAAAAAAAAARSIVNPFAKPTAAASTPATSIALKRKGLSAAEEPASKVARIFDKSSWGKSAHDMTDNRRPHIVTTVPKSASVVLPSAIRNLISRKAKF